MDSDLSPVVTDLRVGHGPQAQQSQLEASLSWTMVPATRYPGQYDGAVKGAEVFVWPDSPPKPISVDNSLSYIYSS